VANKCDVSDADRKVTYDQGKAMADQFGVSFFEVSAKENKNIAETFDYMARTIKTQILSDEVPIQTRSFTYSKPLVTGEKAKKKNCCWIEHYICLCIVLDHAIVVLDVYSFF